MTTSSQRILVVLAWASAACWLLYCLALRSQLPVDMAIQFNLDGEPNLWLGREMFILFTALLITVDAGIFHRMIHQVGDIIPAALYFVFFFFYGGMIAVFREVLEFKLSDASKTRSGPSCCGFRIGRLWSPRTDPMTSSTILKSGAEFRVLRA